MGARIELTEGHAPVTLHGGPLRGLDYQTPIASAQVKTCLLFAGLQASGTTQVHESVHTRDHGELALRAFGAEIERSKLTVSIAGGQKLHGIDASVPAIFPRRHFSCARRRCFRSLTWCWMGSG